MSEESTARLGRIAAGVAAATAALALLGYLADAPDLRTWGLVHHGMAPLSAVAVLIAVAAVVLAHHAPAASRALGIVVGAYGAVIVASYVVGADLPTDDLFPAGTRSSAGAAPGRTALMTAIAFVELGVALALLQARGRRLVVGQAFAGLAVAAVLLALLGHLYGAPEVRAVLGSTRYRSMAIPTAVALLGVALAALAARPGDGFAALLRSPYDGGRLLRRLGAAVLLVPMAVGLVVLLAEREAWFGAEVALALLAAATTLVLATLMVVTARRFEAGDARRGAVLEAVADAVLVLDETGRVVQLNRAGRALLGVEEPRPRHLRLQDVLADPVELAAGTRWLETEARRADGTRLPVEVTVSVLDASGSGAYVAAVRDLSARREADEARRLLAAIVKASHDPILAWDRSGLIIVFNEAAERLHGYRAADVLGRHAGLLVPGTQAETVERMQTMFERLERGEPTVEDLQVRHRDGHAIDVMATFMPLHDDHGTVTAAAAIMRDVTERRRLERQLNQNARLEAVGRLAGGIAHDFNNLLTVISTYGELASERLGEEAAGAELDEIRAAARRGSRLTAQLLAFARQQVLEPELVDVADAVQRLMPMLEALIDERVQIVAVASPEPHHVLADPGQLEQMVVNLVVNARDAMPEGGTLSLRVQAVTLDDDDVRHNVHARPGRHVCLAISDTGTGMEPEAVERVFDPFYTTKELGSGLGLASVHGIVEQSGGHVSVYSEVGHGTTFRVYLPAVDGPAAAAAAGGAAEPSDERLDGTETILLTEDEDGIRRVVHRILTGHGYTVMHAPDPATALELILGQEHRIDALVTDVIMPGMTGLELSRLLRERLPELRTLFLSGYTADVVTEGELPPGSDFLEKPFDARSLASRLRRLLDARVSPGPRTASPSP